ncbi:MAG: DUF4326 domain-containing protein [Nitrospina sp.]|nr:DUF4326 domain-containing protein [Nitrospina sp.]
MEPKRIQRKRAKGWRKPDNTVIVDRASRWGNPYKVTENLPADEAVRMYRADLMAGGLSFTVEDVRRGQPGCRKGQNNRENQR